MARRGKRTLVRASMGLISMLVGAFLVVRPFSAHSVLVLALAIGFVVAAVAESVQGTREAPARWLLGVGYLAGAVLITVWPQVPLVVIAVVVGLLLLATGALEVWSGLLSRTTLPALLVGAAEGGLWVALSSGLITLLIGAVTALWADVVLLPMTFALGARLLMVGAGLLVDVWYPPTGLGVSTERLRLAWRLISLVLAVALLVVGLVGNNWRPRPSAFYYLDIPSDTAPGKLLKAERYAESPVAGEPGIRLLYSTKDLAGRSLVASGVLYVPGSTSGAVLPLVVWAHSDTGIDQGCAPSVRGESTGGLNSVNQLLAAGYAVLAPDYQGMGAAGTPSYLVGIAEGRALLDAVRATAQVPGLKLGSVVFWGHSQGGHAALWAGQIAAQYAPEVKIAGIAVDAPIANPAAVLASELQNGHNSRLAGYLLHSYAANYPDVDPATYQTPKELRLSEELVAGCGEIGWAVQNWAAITGATGAWSTEPGTGPLAERLAENTAAGTLTVPLLVTQGAADQVVGQAVTDAEVSRRCQAGEKLDYRVYAGLGHTTPASVEAPQFGDLLAWTADRFAGRTASNTCAQLR